MPVKTNSYFLPDDKESRLWGAESRAPGAKAFLTSF